MRGKIANGARLWCVEDQRKFMAGRMYRCPAINDKVNCDFILVYLFISLYIIGYNGSMNVCTGQNAQTGQQIP